MVAPSAAKLNFLMNPAFATGFFYQKYFLIFINIEGIFNNNVEYKFVQYTLFLLSTHLADGNRDEILYFMLLPGNNAVIGLQKQNRARKEVSSWEHSKLIAYKKKEY